MSYYHIVDQIFIEGTKIVKIKNKMDQFYKIVKIERLKLQYQVAQTV
jgi:hypothetical protein